MKLHQQQRLSYKFRNQLNPINKMQNIIIDQHCRLMKYSSKHYQMYYLSKQYCNHLHQCISLVMCLFRKVHQQNFSLPHFLIPNSIRQLKMFYFSLNTSMEMLEQMKQHLMEYLLHKATHLILSRRRLLSNYNQFSLLSFMRPKFFQSKFQYHLLCNHQSLHQDINLNTMKLFKRDLLGLIRSLENQNKMFDLNQQQDKLELYN